MTTTDTAPVPGSNAAALRALEHLGPENYVTLTVGGTICLPCEDHEHDTCYGGRCECDHRPCGDEEPDLLVVNYTVPVVVHVDLNDDRVTRVVVIDEEVRLDESYGNRGVDRPGARPYSGSLADRARQVAEQAEWPAWEHGF